MLALQSWQNFYMLTGTAAATLLGLLFIAVTIGGYIPTEELKNSLQTFVTPTLLYYAQVLLIACLAVTPLQSLQLFNGAWAILGCINIFLALRVLWRVRALHRNAGVTDFWHWFWHVILPFFIGLLLVSVAIGFFLKEQLSLVGLALADLLCLAVGLHNTWALTIWLRIRRGQPFSEGRNDGYGRSMKEEERVPMK